MAYKASGTSSSAATATGAGLATATASAARFLSITERGLRVKERFEVLFEYVGDPDGFPKFPPDGYASTNPAARRSKAAMVVNCMLGFSFSGGWRGRRMGLRRTDVPENA